MRIIACFLLVLFGLPSFGQTPEIGIVQNMEYDSLLFADGYRSLAESIGKCFSPKTLTDEQFEEKLKIIQKLKVPIVVCNIFIPGEMKIVGPTVDESALLKYVEVVFQRCQKAKVNMIVWGSGGSRRLPEGFDKEKAKEQFVSTGRKVAELAKRYDITLALESLNRTETNFINTVDECLKIATRVDHPNFRLNVDIYHMLKEDEGPAIIETARKYIVHCEIAEKEKRTPPGTVGDDFKEYLKVLKKIKFKGRIMLECRWDNVALQAGSAKIALQKQLDDVYK